MAERIEPGEAYWRVVEPVWRETSIYDGPEVFLSGFSCVPTEVGHLYAGHWCQSEVCNGGFHQFFTNPTGVLAPEALDGFRAIGLSKWVELPEEAMRFFGSPYPRASGIRQARLSEFDRDNQQGAESLPRTR